MRETEKNIRILIADDHQLVRRGLRQTIEAERGLTVVAETNDGQAAYEQTVAMLPDVVILDVDMPKLDGLEAARAIVAAKLPVEIIFLTIHSEEALFEAALDLGAKGFVLKDSAADDIVDAIKSVVNKRYFTSLPMTDYLLARGDSRHSLEKPRRDLIDKLTPTELKILKMLAEYKTSKEIGNALNISHRTVEAHRANMCQKFDLQGSHSLTKFALEHRRQF